jgi:enediyne biosynthesis protein E4
LARVKRLVLLWVSACTTAAEPPAPPFDPTIERAHPEDVTWLAARRAAQEAEGPAPGFRFTAVDAGIRFRHRIVGDAGKSYKAVHYDHGNGLAAADVDNDGRVDLYFTSQLGGTELWRNLGGGRFEDVTARAGVRLADRVSVAATFADLDNDGDADLFVTTVKMGNVLFENTGGGVFRDVSAAAGVAATAHSSGIVPFDFDRDGLLDLFVANVGVYTTQLRAPEGYFVGFPDAFHGHLVPDRAERSFLYRNRGGLVFEEVAAARGLDDRGWSGDATMLDVDADGWLDLYVLNMQGDDHLWLNRGGRFELATARWFPKTPWGSMGVKVLDANGDGALDLFVTDMHSDMTEDLAPAAVARERAKAQVLMDDHMLQGGADNIFGNALWLRDGGGFREVSDAFGAENYWPWGVSAGDVDGDGFTDALVTASMNYPFRYGLNSLLLSDAGKRFLHRELVLGVEPRAGSVTRRDWFELDCAGADRGHPRCERCEPWCGRALGPGRRTIDGTLGSRSSVLFDLEGDGDLDVVTNEFNGPPQVLVSDLATRRGVRSLEVTLAGTRSNRDGLGALVTLRLAGGRALVQQHDGKSGYLSTSRLPLWFGWPAGETPEALEVVWPSGRRQRVTAGLVSGARLLVAEGS